MWHPEFIGFADKFARLKQGANENPFIEANACQTYAAAARKRLEQRCLGRVEDGLTLASG